jgi:S-adenosylmethionine hydrolase
VTRPILFLSDYGLEDEYVGVCHAVIARLAPDAPVIDLTHRIRPHDVLAGALTLASVVHYGPEDAVYLAVVDPGVGTARRAVALEAGTVAMVGPDNGLLGEAAAALGGIRRAVQIAPERVSPWPPSHTFHGRDLFAPAAARLSAGGSLDQLGDAIDPATIGRTRVGAPLVENGRVAARVIGVDRFGNLRLDARPQHLEDAGLSGGMDLLLEGATIPLRQVDTFAEIQGDEYGLLVDSDGWLSVARNQASAAEALGLRVGNPVILAPPNDAVG